MPLCQEMRLISQVQVKEHIWLAGRGAGTVTGQGNHDEGQMHSPHPI